MATRKVLYGLAMLLSVFLVAGRAAASPTIDLAVNNSGDITTNLGTLTFIWDQTQPSGTGVLYPFVRIQKNGNEQGYNTTQPNAGALPFNEKFGIYTHDLLIADLKADDTNTFYQFVLDAPEGGSFNPISPLGILAAGAGAFALLIVYRLLAACVLFDHPRDRADEADE